MHERKVINNVIHRGDYARVDKDKRDEETIIALGSFSGKLNTLRHEAQEHMENTRSLNRITERENQRIAFELDCLETMFHNLMEVEVEGPF